ncbi:MAG: O-antigen ligase family protein [Longicatena sp.]
MKRIDEFLDKYLSCLAKLIIILTIISTYVTYGIYSMHVFGTITNYIISGLAIIYFVGFVIARRKNMNFKDKYLLLIILFLLCNVLTIIMNPGKAHNFKILVLTAIQWIILFMFVKDNKKFTYRIMDMFNYGTFLATTISLILFLLNIVVTNYIERYCGIYQNPNFSSIIAALSAGISIILFYMTDSRKKKYFLILNLVLQIIFMRISMSRAGSITIFAFILVFATTYSALYYKKFLFVFRNIILSIFAFVLINNFLAIKVYQLRDILNFEGSVSEKDAVERSKENASQSNNYRYMLLTSGVKAAKDNPIIGCGLDDLPRQVSSKSTETLDGVKGGGVHNSYLQLFVANGLLGFITFASLQVLIIWNLLKRKKYILKLTDKKEIVRISGFIALYISLLLYGMFEAQLVLNNSIVTNMFALSAGGLCNDE